MHCLIVCFVDMVVDDVQGIVYNLCRLENTVTDRRVYVFQHRDDVKSYLVSYDIVNQICAVGYVCLAGSAEKTFYFCA